MSKYAFEAQNGLSNSNRNENNKYAVGNLIDPTKDWGYLKPALSGTSITTTSLGGTIRDITRIDATTAYAIDNAKLHLISDGAITTTSPFPHSLSDSYTDDGSSVVSYVNKRSGTLYRRVFYFGNGTWGGMYDPAIGAIGDFQEDWINTVPASAAEFSSTQTTRPYFLWQENLVIGDGRYVVLYNGLTGDNGTYYSQYFDVGQPWEIKCFFQYYSYLGIIVQDYNGADVSQVILIDGSSSTGAIKRITVNEKIIGAWNLEDSIIFITQDISGKCYIKELGDDSIEFVKEIKFENTSTAGTFDTYSAPTTIHCVDKYDNKLAFACKTGTTPFVFVFGKNKDGTYIIYKPFNVTGQNISCVKWIDDGDLYVASYTSTSYYLQRFITGNSTATLKYPFKDFGYKIRLNFIKFYFKTLESGDSMTVGLEIDHGTSVTLKDMNNNSTIAYASDGAITSKRFNIGRDCHSVRPTITWSSGGTSIAYVVVDYDYLPDDN